ncbi:MAG: hypothetical protein WCD76_11505 [Pyrinomonadaceae bacterium]
MTGVVVRMFRLTRPGKGLRRRTHALQSSNLHLVLASHFSGSRQRRFNRDGGRRQFRLAA